MISLDTLLLSTLEGLTSFSSWGLSGLTFGVCVLLIFAFLKGYGAWGLCVYQVLAFLVANIQVLKVSPFPFLQEPLALGTVVFATTFLVSGLLTEFYGQKVAQKCIGMAFIAQIGFTALLILTMAHESIVALVRVDEAMKILFLPSLRILVASFLAFWVSQLLDISLFQFLKKLSAWLWVRSYVSTFVASLVDHILFSVLAWYVLAPVPVSVETLIWTYFLGSYVARGFVAIVFTPFLYLSRLFVPSDDLKKVA